MAASDSEDLRKHALTLLGLRKTGSTTEIGLQDIPGDTPIQPYHSATVKPGCRAFHFKAEMGARIGAVRMDEALDLNVELRVREGVHGPEVFCELPGEGLETHDIVVILGPSDGTEVVYTWHPGFPLAPFGGVFWTADTAVKIDYKG